MKIVITGGGGFIGFKPAKALLARAEERSLSVTALLVISDRHGSVTERRPCTRPRWVVDPWVIGYDAARPTSMERGRQ